MQVVHRAIHNSIQRLPAELLSEVLRHVDQPHRLRCCALVDRRWRQAANMATSMVDCSVSTSSINSLSLWLHVNASTVEGIQVKHCEAFNVTTSVNRNLRLPATCLHQLQTLQLQRCNLKMTIAAHMLAQSANVLSEASAAAASQTQSLAALTALRSLDLQGSQVDLSHLDKCRALQHLAICEINHQRDPATAARLCKPLASCQKGLLAGQVEEPSYECSLCLPPDLVAALPHLTELTHLAIFQSHQVHTRPVGAPISPVSLSNLVQLQELHLSLDDYEDVNITHLPSGLTLLHLCYAPGLSRSTLPQLHLMTQLRELHLTRACSIDAVLLSGLTQLTWLSLQDSPFTSVAAVQGLLSALKQLDRLQHLDLDGSLADYVLPSEQYAALTASSHLKSLDINNCIYPPLAYMCIFPAPYRTGSAAAFAGTLQLTALVANAHLLNCAGSIESLTARCPALQHICISNPSESPVYRINIIDLQGLSTLTTLTALTHLALDIMEPTEDALTSIAACSQLKQLDLDLFDSRGCMTYRAVLQLTQLTCLVDLSLVLQNTYQRLDLHMVSKQAPQADVYHQLQNALLGMPVLQQQLVVVPQYVLPQHGLLPGCPPV